MHWFSQVFLFSSLTDFMWWALKSHHMLTCLTPVCMPSLFFCFSDISNDSQWIPKYDKHPFTKFKSFVPHGPKLILKLIQMSLYSLTTITKLVSKYFEFYLRHCERRFSLPFFEAVSTVTGAKDFIDHSGPSGILISLLNWLNKSATCLRTTEVDRGHLASSIMWT